jgi:diguanylate cyclase (GGDEF)-like protein/PAS domain S-box-containing protein
LERLQQVLAPQRAVVVGREWRYRLQLHVIAMTEAEALFSAAARWRDAMQLIGLPTWPLAHAEVLTVEEFDRIQAEAPDRPPRRDPISVGEGGDDQADDLLARALRDSLTGLAGRELFADRVRAALARDERVGEGEADTDWLVFVFDLDQFGAFNRFEGAVAGDRVLAVLASRISRVPEYTAVARLGGDEFAVLVRDRGAGAEHIGVGLLEIIRAPIELADGAVAVTASVGAATSARMSYPDDLMRDAATAMCVAKADGGDCFRRYDPGVAVDDRRLEFDADPAPDRLANVLLLERAALAANECQSLEDAASIVLQQVCAHAGWPLGHLSLVDATGEMVQPTSVWHTAGPDHFEPFRQACDAIWLGSGQGAAGQALETGKLACIAEISSAPRFPAPLAAAAAEVGIRSVAAFPILVGSEVVAFLEFYCSGKRRIYEALREVMTGVCVQLGRVAERGRAQDAQRDNELRLRALLATSGAMIILIGADGGVIADYPGTSGGLGYPQGSTSGRLGFEFVHPDDLARTAEAFRVALEHSGVGDPFRCRVRDADGAWRWVEAVGNNLLDYPPVRAIVISAVDIDERVMADENLAAAEERLSHAGEVSRLGLWHVVTATGEFGWTDGVFEILGLPVGRPLTLAEFIKQVVHPDDRVYVAQRAASPPRGQACHVVEFRVIRPDGVIRRVRTRSMAVGGSSGPLTVVSGSLEDVTDFQPADELAGRTGAA